MKQLAKKLAVLALTGLAANQAVAATKDFCPYVGIEAQQSWRGLESDWKNTFARTGLGANAFIGGRMIENVGLEVAYNWGPKKHKYTTIATNTTTTPAGIAGAKAKSKISVRGWSIDVPYFIPVEENDVIVSVGAAWRKASITWESKTAGAASVLNSNVTGIRGDKYKVVPRVGLGMQTQVNDHFGVRGMLRWEQISKARLRNTAVARSMSGTLKPLRDGVALSLAAFYQF